MEITLDKDQIDGGKKEKIAKKEAKEKVKEDNLAYNVLIDNIIVKDMDIKIDPKDKILGPIKKDLDELLPDDLLRQSIKFNLRNVSVSVANALRRTIIEELPVRTLSAKKIDTNEEFLIPSEILDRVQFIPISQDTPTRATLSLDIANTTKNTIRVYSSEIVGNKKYFSEYFHIAELRDGRYLHIPEITVETGYGYQHAKFMLTNDITYQNLDILSVDLLNEKANVVRRQMSLADIQSKMLNAKYSKAEIDRVNPKSKILIVPSDINEQKLDQQDREIIAKKYPIIIREAVNFVSSFNTESRNFFIKIRTKGNIRPEQLLTVTCKNLIERLFKVKNSLDKNLTSFKTHSGEVFSLVIEGETHTIGELMRKHIYALDPTIVCLKKRMNHLRDRNVYIELIHSDPKGIILKACDECIAIFEKIKSYFVN